MKGMSRHQRQRQNCSDSCSNCLCLH